MVDPDAPSPDNPEFAEFLHWIVDDIPNGAGTHGASVELWPLRCFRMCALTRTPADGQHMAPPCGLPRLAC